MDILRLSGSNSLSIGFGLCASILRNPVEVSPLLIEQRLRERQHGPTRRRLAKLRYGESLDARRIGRRNHRVRLRRRRRAREENPQWRHDVLRGELV